MSHTPSFTASIDNRTPIEVAERKLRRAHSVINHLQAYPEATLGGRTRKDSIDTAYACLRIAINNYEECLCASSDI
jgi:hypothetical protein